MEVLATRWRTFPALLCVSLCCTAVTARPLDQTRTWDQLPADITNEAIGLALPDGTRLRGIGRGIQGDELILDVRRSSNSRMHPNGTARIPRADVSVVDVYSRHQAGGNRGAAIGVGVGLAASSPAAVYLGETNNSGLAGVALVAGAVAGWYVGHHFFDRDRTDASHVRITVVPAQGRAAQP